MIDLREIDDTIRELKNTGTTVGAAEKLALLYIARDYMQREDHPAQTEMRKMRRDTRAYSGSAEVYDGSSEFRAVCSGLCDDALLDVLDKHMEAIRVLYPKEYRAVVKRIEEIE